MQLEKSEVFTRDINEFSFKKVKSQENKKVLQR